MDTRFILSFSIAIGSIIMIILNLIFFGNGYATMFLGFTTALNLAVLASSYPDETKEALRRIFWR